MFNTHRTHHGVRRSATHTHARNNPDEITTPADPAWERLVPSSTGVVLQRIRDPVAPLHRVCRALIPVFFGPLRCWCRP